MTNEQADKAFALLRIFVGSLGAGLPIGRGAFDEALALIEAVDREIELKKRRPPEGGSTPR